MKTKFFLFIIFFILSIGVMVSENVAFAYETGGSNSNSTVKLDNPLSGIETPQQFIGQIIKTLLSVVGSIALLVFIYGGLQWMLARGNQSKVQEASSMMLWASLGLLVIFSSYLLVRFVFESIGAK